MGEINSQSSSQLAEQLIDLALKAGASCAEVYQSNSLAHPVFFEANRLKQLESSEAQGIALRLWREGCPGLAVAYGRVEPQVLVDKALALSQLNPPEPIELASEQQQVFPNFGDRVEVGELVKLGREAIALIRARYPEVLCSAELQCEQETTLLINSQNLHCQYTDITLSASLGVEWVRGEDFLGIYEDQETRNELEMERLLQAIWQRLTWAENNTLPPKGCVPILFTSKAATMLWGTICEATNSKRILEGSSPWSQQQGETVLSPLLTLSQKPDFGPYSCPFDDEGTPTQTLALIVNGQLNHIYTDRTVGRKLGISSTGNGFRPSLGRYPTPDLINLIIEPGEGTFNELVRHLDDGLIVDQMLGEGADISGDFSINVELGYRVRDGQIVGRVKDTMLAGNVYTALKQVMALGGDAQWQGFCYTPSLIVDSLSVVSS
ncbi:TldD/PmbA family protein [Spirulina subsalsa FACHB-351]|uniref:TldD/PmbA family protein n=1 Tax=Spirulina subsalsa FACHB-351 TaxID=234711 RepID=A0ABT3LAV4_9CYAN|nr:TldD/PmbA family protein [Spirulina subsalsa]MCW6038645.1 TldD/PmbA family protein [Spirulina subsalsa FACHB-351]